jgi:hypothetical protein
MTVSGHSRRSDVAQGSSALVDLDRDEFMARVDRRAPRGPGPWIFPIRPPSLWVTRTGREWTGRDPFRTIQV